MCIESIGEEEAIEGDFGRLDSIECQDWNGRTVSREDPDDHTCYLSSLIRADQCDIDTQNKREFILCGGTVDVHVEGDTDGNIGAGVDVDFETDDGNLSAGGSVDVERDNEGNNKAEVEIHGKWHF